MVKKIWLIVFGLLAGLIIVELGLNAAEAVYSKEIKADNQKVFDFDTDACRIICLGDSWTLGMGAVAQQDYPKQLETILNASKSNKRFRVYNLGYPNFTSAMAIEKFKDLYPRLKPQIVIAMIGRSDLWNPDNIVVKTDFLEKTKQKLLRMRIIRLIKISWYNLLYDFSKKQNQILPVNEQALRSAMDLVKAANKEREEKNFGAAEEYYSKALGLAPSLITALLEKGRCYKMEGQYAKALNILSQAFSRDMTNAEIAGELNDIFIRLNDPEKRVDFYYKLFQDNPDSSILKNNLVKAYIFLADSFFETRQFDKTIENYDKALVLDPENSEVYSSIIYNQSIISRQGACSLKHLPEKKVSQNMAVFFLNLQELVAICKKQNIELILSGYPLEMMVPMQEIAAEYKIPLIDQRESFLKASGDLFVKDGHCNSAGYKIVAENVAKYILSRQENRDNAE